MASMGAELGLRLVKVDDADLAGKPFIVAVSDQHTHMNAARRKDEVIVGQRAYWKEMLFVNQFAMRFE